MKEVLVPQSASKTQVSLYWYLLALEAIPQCGQDEGNAVFEGPRLVWSIPTPTALRSTYRPVCNHHRLPSQP